MGAKSGTEDSSPSKLPKSSFFLSLVSPLMIVLCARARNKIHTDHSCQLLGQ